VFCETRHPYFELILSAIKTILIHPLTFFIETNTALHSTGYLTRYIRRGNSFRPSAPAPLCRIGRAVLL